MNIFKKITNTYNSIPLIVRIVIGLVIGATLGIFIKNATAITLLGSIFVGALKGIAPILVFFLVASSLSQKGQKMDSRFGLVILLYMSSTLLASGIAVIASFIFPQTLILKDAATAEAIPMGIGEVLSNLLTSMVANPVEAIMSGRYIGILFWAVMIGLVLKKKASNTTVTFISDLSETMSQIVRYIINLAPFGILGLVYENISTNGLSIFTDYGRLLLLLVGCMLLVALIVDPLIVAIVLKKNPYPLVSIPLGATINMDGAAVTIAVMALAAANTAGVTVTLPAALALSLIATLAACGASGVAGGSLLLVPMACSLFGVSSDIAMQVVAIGFIISVVQDSVETALNSSGDVLFAATAEYKQWKKDGKPLPDFLGGTTKTEV